MNGKGSKRRPRLCTREEEEQNWKRTFEKKRYLKAALAKMKKRESTSWLLRQQRELLEGTRTARALPKQISSSQISWPKSRSKSVGCEYHSRTT